MKVFFLENYAMIETSRNQKRNQTSYCFRCYIKVSTPLKSVISTANKIFTSPYYKRLYLPWNNLTLAYYLFYNCAHTISGVTKLNQKKTKATPYNIL